MIILKRPELLAPAGDMEKLKFAFIYGADAVYLGGKQWGLRASAGNFTLEEIKEAVEFAHNLHKKLYVTVNILAHNEDLNGLAEYLEQLQAINVDGLIISDPGILAIARKVIPDMVLHLSTQANTTNWAAAEFWHGQGVNRIVLARELSLKEIKEIIQKVPIEIEVFVHGAMCMAYSGRCLLSNFLVGRGANQGECAHPCRYKYYLIEEKRPGQIMAIEEDNRGSYIFNSKDLCLLEYIPQLIDAGISSFKIEGRMKSVHYVATVVKAYRQAIDAYMADPSAYTFDKKLLDEVSKVSHREYTTGFYFNKITADDHNYQTSSYKRTHSFIGIVIGYDEAKKCLIVEQRNNFKKGDLVEFCPPKGDNQQVIINELYDEEWQLIDKAPHPQQVVYIPSGIKFPKYTLIRKEK